MSALVETMAYAGEVPWHGLGTKVPNDISTNDMLQQSGLDWSVEKQPTFTVNQVPTGSFALVRNTDNKVLAPSVGKNWNPVQNKEAFDFFAEYVESGDLEMHTAGSLMDGKMVWALAKVKQGFELFKGDEVENYMLFSNPHQFGKSIDIRMTPIRVVCNNTLTLSLSAKSDSMITVNHRKEFNEDEVKDALGIAREKMQQYKSMAEFLGSKRYSADNVVNYFNEVFGSPAKSDDKIFTSRNAKIAHDNLQEQPGAEFAEGSWWQAFNSVTHMTDHLQGRSTDGRLTSAWYGRNRKVKLKALDKALEYAEKV